MCSKFQMANPGVFFVHELARLLQAYADSSAFESASLYAAMTMPALITKAPQVNIRSRSFQYLKRHLSA